MAPGLAMRFERTATHGRENVGGLFTAHHRDLRVRPGPKEARRICTTAHAVVAGAVRAADQHREFRPLRGRHRRHHLRAVARDAFILVFAADHETGDVLTAYQRDLALSAQLYAVSGAPK